MSRLDELIAELCPDCSHSPCSFSCIAAHCSSVISFSSRLHHILQPHFFNPAIEGIRLDA